MSKVYEVAGYFNDDQSGFENLLVTDSHQTPEGYTDDLIFYYGIDESRIISDHGDFTITTYREVTADGQAITDAITGKRLMRCAHCKVAQDSAVLMHYKCSSAARHQFTEAYEPYVSSPPLSEAA